MIVIMMIISSYIILTALYIGDDVCIVYALAIYDAIFFSNRRMDGQTNKAILGEGYEQQLFLHVSHMVSLLMFISRPLRLLSTGVYFVSNYLGHVGVPVGQS